MLHKHLRILGLLVIGLLGVGAVAAQEAKKPAVEKAVYWASEEPSVEIYLVADKAGGYRLTVLSPKAIAVIYRTKINSAKDVTEELQPQSAGIAGVRIYRVKHRFSRTTIWMSLEFKVDGKPVPDLTRTFYGDIYTVATDK